MNARFTAYEFIELAMDVEKNGEYFYSEHAKRLPKGVLKDLFVDLANQETSHYEYFQTLRNRIKGQVCYLDCPGNQELYIKALADENVFVRSKIDEMLDADEFLSVDEILDYALDMEYSSIMFYNTLRPYLTRRERPLLDKVVHDEGSHVTYLEGLKRKIA
jgi:rubrerythrin